MGQLVRDEIPAIIRASGRNPRVTTLTTSEYRNALRNKLNEELAEFAAACTLDGVREGAADVVEVLVAMASVWGVSLADILEKARRKRIERGGFDKRLRLDGVESMPECGGL